MNFKKFFDKIRGQINLTMGNVPEIEYLIKEAARRNVSLDKLSYILATTGWETAMTFLPVREAYWKDENWRKRNLRYYPYYGRGYVQLTWDYNYEKAKKKFGHDFVNFPDMAMNKKYATEILFTGMEEGWFTGKKLDDYIDDVDEPDSEDLREYKNARRIINGTDKALKIAELAVVFEHALRVSGYDPKMPIKAPEKPVEKLPDVPATKPLPEVKPSLWSVIADFLSKLFKGG